MDKHWQLPIPRSGPIRIDQTLWQALFENVEPRISRRKLHQAIKEGKIRVNDRVVKPSWIPTVEQFPLEISFVDFGVSESRTEKIELLYEDDQILAVNKPATLSAEPELAQLALKQGVALNPELPESGLLHRLDPQTSGVLLFAKTAPAYEKLRSQWNQETVVKVYRCKSVRKAGVSLPSLEEPIRLPIGHRYRSSQKMRALTGDKPGKSYRYVRNAQTHVNAIRPIADDLFDFEVRILTGVRHQIRCHLAAIGFPILGDLLYGGPPSERVWLHHWRLTVQHGDRAIEIEAPLPSSW